MEEFDAVVIGAGPGGEVVADKLAAAGRRVALVEQELIGGECGYYACIPSKTLLHPLEVRAAAAEAAGLSVPDLDWAGLRAYRDTMVRHFDDARQVDGYADQGVAVVKGTAQLTARDPWVVAAGGRTLTAPDIVVATGSTARIPDVEGIGDVPVWTNRELTALESIPSAAVVLGGGAVAAEMGQFLARMGTRVTLVERSERIIAREEPPVGAAIAAALRADGADVRTGAQVRRVRRAADGPEGDVLVEFEDGSTAAGEVLVAAAGRIPNAAGLGLAGLGIPVEPSGIPVDDRCRAAPGLWAVGDVNGISPLTHVAKYQGRVVADNLLGRDRRADYTAVPRVLFTDPEAAAVGLTAAQAERAGLRTASAEVDLTAELARPWTLGPNPSGRLGLLADTDRGVLVGAWAVAPMAGEWIHTAALAIREAIPVERLLDQIPQFPTFTEGYLSALERLPR